MTLAVVGLGMASPCGLSAREHAFFVRAHVPSPEPSPFVTRDGDPVRVRFCPWIGARAGVVERLVALGAAALDEALAPIDGLVAAGRSPLSLTTAHPRAGLSASERDRVQGALADKLRAPAVARTSDAAGFFRALAEAETTLGRREVPAVVLLALDSYVAPAALGARIARPPSTWSPVAPFPSEAAAALVVMTPADARRDRIPVLGHIHKSAAHMGAANDDNDEPSDAGALSAVLRDLPAAAPFQMAVGPQVMDDLRRREWYMAMARAASRFDPMCAVESIEMELGDLGAASGAMNLAHGLAKIHHEIAPPAVRQGRFVAWALSRDGTRGAAAAGGAGAS